MKRFLLIFLAVVVIMSTGCAATSKKRYSAEFLELFDTMTIIIGYSDSKEGFSAVAETIYNQLKEYHALYDIYNDYSDVNNIKTINDNAGKAPVTVDSRIIDMLLFAKEAYQTTDGKCNVALGAVLRIWHEYRKEGINDPENAKLPPENLLLEAAKHTDIDKVVIDAEMSTVYLEDPLMSLDVGAIAKGYAAERVALSVAAMGVDNILMSVGGNIRAIGGKPDDKSKTLLPWTVGIKNPFDTSGQDLVNVSVTGKSVVTSGNYERTYMVDGNNYHHIIDPATLMPAAYFSSVSVLCADSGMADALSTALFNMPYDQGRALVDSLDNTGAMWVFSDGVTKYSSYFSDAIANS